MFLGAKLMGKAVAAKLLCFINSEKRLISEKRASNITQITQISQNFRVSLWL